MSDKTSPTKSVDPMKDIHPTRNDSIGSICRSTAEEYITIDKLLELSTFHDHLNQASQSAQSSIASSSQP
jgi:hypothetical protein